MQKKYVIVRELKETGVWRMKRIINVLWKEVFCLAVMVATVCVNTTCNYKMYQEELPEELNRLKKHA